MIINKIYIRDFGNLSDFSLTPTDGLNIIYAPNESGKTTLFSFIKYIFYGSRSKRQKGDMTIKERYMPWNGMPMGGSIELTSDGIKYIISRSEGNKNGSRYFEVVNALNGKTCHHIENPGEYFFGVDEKLFSDTFFADEIHLMSGINGDIANMIYRSDNEENSYIRVKSELEEKILSLTSLKRASSSLSVASSQHKKSESELIDIEKEILQVESEISVISKQEKQIQVESEDLNHQLNSHKQSEKYMRYCELKAMKAKEEQNLALLKQHISDTDNALPYELSDTEISVLKSDESSYDKSIHIIKNICKISFVFLMLSVVASLVFSTFAIKQSYAFFALVMFAFVSAVVFVTACIKSKHLYQNKRNICVQKDKILNKIGAASYEDYLQRRAVQTNIKYDSSVAVHQMELSQLRLNDIIAELNHYKQINPDIDFDNLSNIIDTNSFTKDEINDIIKRIDYLGYEIQKIRINLNNLSKRREELFASKASYEKELSLISSKIADINSKADVYRTALDILDNAFSKMRDTLIPNISARAYSVFSKVCTSAYSALVSDESLETSVKTDMGFKSIGFLSRATRELANISLRIALCDFLSGKSQLPLFFDDVLSSFDDDRCLAMLDSFYTVSKQRQTFLCTCRSRETKYFNGITDVNIISIRKDDNNG